MSWRENPRQSWLSQARQSFSHVSTHQTYVGKALYEHAPDCATIAAVACMSSSLLKSSLGPNLLGLIHIEWGTFELFDKIFLEYNPHMQLTQHLSVENYVGADKEEVVIRKLKASGPLFSSSLQEAKIESPCLPLLEGFRALRSLTLTWIEQSEELAILKSLPSLSELTLLGCRTFDAAFFKALGDLENNRKLTSLVIENFSERSWCSEGFQKDFCGRLLSKNRLANLYLRPRIFEWMNGADREAFVNAGMTNLVELRCARAKLIRGEGFGNLRILSLQDGSDDDLVNIGNHCLFLEVLETSFDIGVTGAFLSDKNLVEGAFKYLRELKFAALPDFDAGTGFSRLHSLEKLSISADETLDASFLQQLPNPDRLRKLVVAPRIFSIHNATFVCGKLSMSGLHRFVNLEEMDLRQFKLSREDILSFALFKKLKWISLAQCGEDIASSEPFRILCPQLPNLEKLSCLGFQITRWTEEDVEAILITCQCLRELHFCFDSGHGPLLCEGVGRLKKKYSWVEIMGVLQKKKDAEQESGSRREREE